MDRLDLTLKWGIAFLGSAGTYLLGGWSELISFFLLAILIDYVTGLAASIKEGNGLSSKVGFWGIAKKGLMILVVILAHRLDVLMGTDVIMIGSIYFYLANELISVTENYGRLGLPLPNKIKEIIAVLKQKGGDQS
ncbi:phage holin family protein [Paenibacillus macquariensis]|uniref:Toxin secretion/phage lysis holin n=1 Tax=Paenibacillus macquariensis TaxID=948756 RepID=A0ABY1JXH4_9BACL|nr:toxin secretion/phage lysis holin [Paenibacillus macquariensis]